MTFFRLMSSLAKSRPGRKGRPARAGTLATAPLSADHFSYRSRPLPELRRILSASTLTISPVLRGTVARNHVFSRPFVRGFRLDSGDKIGIGVVSVPIGLYNEIITIRSDYLKQQTSNLVPSRAVSVTSETALP